MSFLEQHLDKSIAKLSMARFYAGSKAQGDLVSVLLSAAKEHLSPTYGTKVLNFFNRLFQLGKLQCRSDYNCNTRNNVF